MDCVNGDNITFTGVKFGRHHTTESGPAFKCSSRFANFSFTGNSHESVSEGGFTDIGFFDVNEFSRSSIGDNAVGFNGNGQPTLTMSTSAPDIARFAGTRFNQPVLTNAPAGIYDNEHTSGKGTFYSTSDYRDSGKFLIIPDINSASPWPDDSRNIIKFGGTLSHGKTLMLPELTILNGTLLRSRVLLDLSSVNFNGQTIGIYNGPTLITTLSSQGIYEFLSVGSTYYRIK